MVGQRDLAVVNRNCDPFGVDPRKREALLKPYLPDTPSNRTPSKSPSRRPRSPRPPIQKSVPPFIMGFIHSLIYMIIHAIFSVYVRFRIAYHGVSNHVHAFFNHHHRTPEHILKDVSTLNRLPEHISVILDFDENNADGGIEGLLYDLGEITAWCASARVPTLSVYERTGVLKSYIPQTHRALVQTLRAWFGNENTPTLSIRAPHHQSYSPPMSPLSNGKRSSPSGSPDRNRPHHLNIVFLSEVDGRETLVDLTKTLAEMAQKGKIGAKDVSASLIDAELSESIMGEPDLLILFGPTVVLDGYPPWHIRLSEIHHEQDNKGVGYQVFLRALRSFAKAEMRVGK